MRDEIIGYQINCYICLAFIEYVSVDKEKAGYKSDKGCPNGCTIEYQSPKQHGVITSLKTKD